MPPRHPPRVLVTRSPRGASELSDRLRLLGVEPILIPTIETVDPTSFAALDTALSGIDAFHWLLFTSANAVEAFRSRLERHAARLSPPDEITQSLPPHLRVAVIGQATARAAESVGLTPDLIPPHAVAESFAEALLPQARQPNGSPTHFLLVRAEEARELLPDTLRTAGALVTVAPAYRTLIPASSIAAIQDLFSRPENIPDAITFTSSSTATNLTALLAAAGLTLPAAPLRISIGPITSGTLRDLGFPPHAESPEATTAALARTVVNTLAALRTH